MSTPLEYVRVIRRDLEHGNPRYTFNRAQLLRMFARAHLEWNLVNDRAAVCLVGQLIFHAMKFILNDSSYAFTETVMPRVTDRECFEYQGVLIIRKEGRGTETDGFTFV